MGFPAFLEGELARRQEHRRFLWTIILTALAACSAIVTAIFADGPKADGSAITRAVGVGALLFLVVVGPISRSLVRSHTTPRQADPATEPLVTRYIKRQRRQDGGDEEPDDDDPDLHRGVTSLALLLSGLSFYDLASVPNPSFGYLEVVSAVGFLFFCVAAMVYSQPKDRRTRWIKRYERLMRAKRGPGKVIRGIVGWVVGLGALVLVGTVFAVNVGVITGNYDLGLGSGNFLSLVTILSTLVLATWTLLEGVLEDSTSDLFHALQVELGTGRCNEQDAIQIYWFIETLRAKGATLPSDLHEIHPFLRRAGPEGRPSQSEKDGPAARAPARRGRRLIDPQGAARDAPPPQS